MVRVFLELARVSNLPTVWTNVLAAWVIAQHQAPDFKPDLLWLLLGASLIYSAGMVLNDACDAAWDRQHRVERPIPSGRVRLGTVWAAGISGLAVGSLLMIFLGKARWEMVACLVAAVVAYDLYHKPWAGSVLVMGACRTLLYLAAASAVAAPSAWPVIPSLLLGAYVVSLTCIARAEARGNVNAIGRWAATLGLMLPALVSLGQWLVAGTSLLGLLPALIFVLWTSLALRRMARRGPAIGEAVGLLLAGIPLVDAVFVAPVSVPLALAFCVLPPLLRYWQRWVAAT